jgi:hypothetical protein
MPTGPAFGRPDDKLRIVRTTLLQRIGSAPRGPRQAKVMKTPAQRSAAPLALKSISIDDNTSKFEPIRFHHF